jgi:glycosyltransferase involved in cell wall biosynthesis
MNDWSLESSSQIFTALRPGLTVDDINQLQKDFEVRHGLNSRDGKIHVLMIGGDLYGCGHIRISIPTKYLNREPDIVAFPTIRVTPELVQWAHILVWQRQHKDEFVHIRDVAARTGRINVFELDDNLHAVPPLNPAYVHYHKGTKPYNDMLNWIRASHLMTVTREPLGEFYKKLCGTPYVILPNSIDFETLPAEQRNDTGRLRIGWVGSSTHQEDLELIVYAITELQKEFDFDFVMMGWDGIDRVKVQDKEMELHDYMKGVKREFHKFVDVADYMNALASLKLDIGLCPVVNNLFNASGKSNIKWLEYSSLHIPSIVSKVSCYTDSVKPNETALVAEKEVDWYKQIKKLIENPELRKQLAENAYNDVKQHYDISKNISLWAGLYRNLSSMRHVPPILSPVPGDIPHQNGV